MLISGLFGRRKYFAPFVIGCIAMPLVTATGIASIEMASANAYGLARVWSSYVTVNSLEADFQDLKQNGVDLIDAKPSGEEDIKIWLAAARRFGLQLSISIPDVTENGDLAASRGISVPSALMIGGAYQGKAIDRHLFPFSAGPHEIVIEPPIYNRSFPYRRGSGATGPQATGEPIGHYFPDMPPPARAEIVVPLRRFDGRQHLKIVPATIELAPPGTELPADSVTPDMPASSETKERELYLLRFDLSGLENALLDRVGIAVFWPYRGTKQYWIFGRGTVTAAAPEARQAVRRFARDEMTKWARAAGGVFPSDTVRVVRVGDESFHITGGVSVSAPAVSYPLWDYSASAIKRFRRESNGLEHPRAWGFPEIYGADAYAWWLYLLHDNTASLLRAARETVREIAPGVRIYRNTTRFGVFHVANDHDGSGPELLTAATDIVHLDPYPVNASGYRAEIPRDMSYYAGLARRYGKRLVPWMQAHTYGGPTGLKDVTPSQVERMMSEQRRQGVDAIMWLGYGHTFPLVRPDSWRTAARLHEEFKANPPAKPIARLAVLRPYRVWALSAYANGKIRNPADWMLQQFLEVWAVEEGQPYDVFELPPSLTKEAKQRLEAELSQYTWIVGTEPHHRAWVIGEESTSQEIDPSRASEFQGKYRRELIRRGWMNPSPR